VSDSWSAIPAAHCTSLAWAGPPWVAGPRLPQPRPGTGTGLPRGPGRRSADSAAIRQRPAQMPPYSRTRPTSTYISRAPRRSADHTQAKPSRCKVYLGARVSRPKGVPPTLAGPHHRAQPTTSGRLVLALPDAIQRIAVQITRRNAIPARIHGRMLGLRPGRRVNAVIRTNYRMEDLVSAAEYVLDKYVLEGLDPVEAAAHLSSELAHACYRNLTETQ
jgi:hypothetical protein